MSNERFKVISYSDIEPGQRSSVVFKRADGIAVIGRAQTTVERPEIKATEPTEKPEVSPMSIFIGTDGSYRIGRRSRVIKETRTKPADKSAHAPFRAEATTPGSFLNWNRMVIAQGENK